MALSFHCVGYLARLLSHRRVTPALYWQPRTAVSALQVCQAQSDLTCAALAVVELELTLHLAQALA
jgi:hypothetical protein